MYSDTVTVRKWLPLSTASTGTRRRGRASDRRPGVSEEVRSFRWQGGRAAGRDAGEDQGHSRHRRDGDLQIVARTDARAVLGLQAAIDRAGAMIEASGSEGIMNPSVLLLQCLGKNW